jgi:hypothetical protein
MKSIILLVLSLAYVTLADYHGWINEIHYRYREENQDGDFFVEVVGPAGEEAWKYLLVFYQGRNGTQFKEGRSLSGYVFSSGIVGDFGFITYDLGGKGAIRKGKMGADGIALVHEGECVQFLCYSNDDDAIFTAWTGPCAGKSCENIGVHETREDTPGTSIQMIGSGRYMENFTWNDEVEVMTPGESNHGQSLLTPQQYFLVSFFVFISCLEDNKR